MSEQVDEFLASTASEIDYHNFIIGSVLAHLKSGGLRRVDIQTADAFGIMRWTRGDEDQAIQAFEDVLHFMLEEGVIRARKVLVYEGGFVFHDVQLSSRGLQLLKLKDGNGTTIAAKLDEAHSSNSEASYWGKIGELAGSFMASFSKTISNG